MGRTRSPSPEMAASAGIPRTASDVGRTKGAKSPVDSRPRVQSTPQEQTSATAAISGLGQPTGGLPSHPLQANDWENEIAKNILTLYQTKMANQAQVEEDDAREKRETARQTATGAAFQRLATSGPQASAEGGGGGNGAGRPSPSRARARQQGGAPSPSPIRAWGGAAASRQGTALGPGGRGAPAGGGKAAGPPPPTASAKRAKNTFFVRGPDGQEAMVVVPKKPAPIWYTPAGTGAAEWGALVTKDAAGAALLRELEGLEEAGKFDRYLAAVEGLLTAQLRADPALAANAAVRRLWKQLAVTAAAFGLKATEQRRYPAALELLRRAEALVDFPDLVDRAAAAELRAYCSDGYAYYYYRRRKPHAALAAAQRAMKAHARRGDWAAAAAAQVHAGAVLACLTRHDEALRCLGQVLHLVEAGRLDVGGQSPQKLCLVAVAYHNIAVEQLALRHVAGACTASQNARRLARLCLSYSNRWLKNFEATHKIALAELAAMNAKSGHQTQEEKELFQKLTMEFYA